MSISWLLPTLLMKSSNYWKKMMTFYLVILPLTNKEERTFSDHQPYFIRKFLKILKGERSRQSIKFVFKFLEDFNILPADPIRRRPGESLSDWELRRQDIDTARASFKHGETTAPELSKMIVHDRNQRFAKLCLEGYKDDSTRTGSAPRLTRHCWAASRWHFCSSWVHCRVTARREVLQRLWTRTRSSALEELPMAWSTAWCLSKTHGVAYRCQTQMSERERSVSVRAL